MRGTSPRASRGTSHTGDRARSETRQGSEVELRRDTTLALRPMRRGWSLDRARATLGRARRQSKREASRRPKSGACAGRAPRRVETPLEETCFQAEPASAICVQSLDDSLNSAIRTTYRISLRSSSLREPRYPSAGVVCGWSVAFSRRGAPSETARLAWKSWVRRRGAGQSLAPATRRATRHSGGAPLRPRSCCASADCGRRGSLGERASASPEAKGLQAVREARAGF